MLMNTKNRIILLASSVLATGILAGCSDWTTPEARDLKQEFPDSYYESLKAYKASDHSISFGLAGRMEPHFGIYLCKLDGGTRQCRPGGNMVTFYP